MMSIIATMTKEFIKNLSSSDYPPFYITLVEGRFTPESVSVELVQGSLKKSEESAKYIEDRWAEFEGEKRPGDEKPSRFRLVDTEILGNQLKLLLDPSINYKDYIGSRTPDFVNVFGKEYSAYPLAVTFMLKTSDNTLVLTYREPFQHDYKPGGLHAGAAGFMVLDDIDQDGVPNPINAAMREAAEEFGIESKDLVNTSCIGVIEDPVTTHPDILYRGSTKLKANEVLAKTVDGENKLLAIEYSEESVKDWILALTHALVPPAIAALVFDGRHNFGEKWYKEVSHRLNLRSKAFCNEQLWRKYEQKDLSRVGKRLQKLGIN